jgi:hypothetical protein
LILRSGGDERQLTLGELRPLSKFATVSKGQGVVLLLTPPVGGFLLLNVVIINCAKKIQEELIGTSPPLRQSAPDALNVCQGYGAYIGGLFLLYAGLSPVLSFLVYRRLSHSMQELVSKKFFQSMGAPIFLLLVTAIINTLVFPATHNKELTNANLLRLTPWAIAFVLGGTAYSYLENERKFAEWIQEPAFRKLVPLIMVATFLLAWTLALS